jgi:hypothetical protein
MLPALAIAAGLASFTLPPGVDTTLVVPRGLDLNVANYAGEVFVEGWDRNELKITADHASEDKVVVYPENGAVVVKAYSRQQDDHTADLRLIVPLWMNVDVKGIHTDVIVTGTEGMIKVETVHGDVIVRGGRRLIDLNTVNDDICVSDAEGTVRAETVNGDAYIWRTSSDSVDVSTVNGDVVYEGSMDYRGFYRFKSHNGDISVGVPRSAGATVAVSTFSGDFESNFPVTLSGNQNARRFQFAVGNGSAHVELSSFQGTIQLYRAVETASARVSKMDTIVDRIIDKRLDKKIEKANKIVQKMQRSQRRHDGDDGSSEDDDGE